MLGKKSGLDLGLRGLLAKISKEFDYPRVVVVRCRVDTHIERLRAPIEVQLRAMSLPQAVVTTPALKMTTAVRSEVLEMATCQQMQPLEEMAARVVTVPCYGARGATLVVPPLVRATAEVRTVEFAMAGPKTQTRMEEIAAPKLHAPLLKMAARVRGGPMLARSLPFYMSVVPIRELGAKLILRYRAAVLRQLGRDPRQIKFLGVVTNLPKAPLSILEYEEGAREGADRVLVRIRGERNIHMGRRAWVLVRIQGQEDVMPITVKEEEA